MNPRGGRIIVALRMAVLWLAAALMQQPAKAGTLDVHLFNVRPTGQLRVSLFVDAASWEARPRTRYKPVAEQIMEASDLRHSVRFEDLAPGLYAIRVEQPAEPNGIIWRFQEARRGNSANSLIRAPSFAAAALQVSGGVQRVEIRLFADSLNW